MFDYTLDDIEPDKIGKYHLICTQCGKEYNTDNLPTSPDRDLCFDCEMLED